MNNQNNQTDIVNPNSKPNQNRGNNVNMPQQKLPQQRPVQNAKSTRITPAKPGNESSVNRVNQPSDKTPPAPGKSTNRNIQNRPVSPNGSGGINNGNAAKNASMANMAAGNLENLQNFQTQKERTQIFDSMTNEKGINTSRLSDDMREKRNSSESGDGSYHHTGKNIRSNRQKLTDVSPNAQKSGKSDYDYDDDNMIVSNKSKSRGKNKTDKDNAADTKSGGFIMSGIVKAILYIVGVILVSIIIAFNIISVANDVFAFVKAPMETTVTIPENATIEDISKILYDSKMIKYPSVFNFYSHYRDKKNSWQFVAGTYPVSSDMNYDQLAAAFMKSGDKLQTISITIPEGYTTDQIIDLFVSKGMGSRDKFVDIINNTKFDYKFTAMLDEQIAANPDKYKDRKYRLEGYLFPDTYEFYTTDTELAVITKFLVNFDGKFDDDYYKRCDIIGMTVDDVVTLASMVEQEAKHPEDFPKISAVFHNRLLNSANFPFLDSDATIQYSFASHKDDLTQADLQQDLPYNTYKKPGLPPSAICNPGLNALDAALFPEPDFNYYYFVANINTGDVYYAQTLAEQSANIIKAKSDIAATTEEGN